jgi:hypothetical protein
MGQPEKRKISKDDSQDLEARARFTFAATAAADAEESGLSTGVDSEGLNSDDLKEYMDKAINEIKRGKNERTHIDKED